MRGRTVKCVLHTIDIHATGAESGRGPRGDHQRMAANDYIRTFEDASAPHDGFGVGRHHFFAGRAVHGDRAGRVRAREKFRHGDRSGEPNRALPAVLIAVECALCAAKSVVFDDDAEIWTRRAATVFGNKSRRQAGDAWRDIKIVGLQVRG